MKKNNALYLFDIPFPESARWISGDQYIRRWVRQFLQPWRGRGPGGLTKVTMNLTLGLQKLGINYRLIDRPSTSPNNQIFGLLNGPKELCQIVAQYGKCIVGPGILNSPQEWQDLFTNYPVIYNIQNCEWAAAMYRPLYGDKVKIWKMGIDEERYAPSTGDPKNFDFLIYDKIRWRDTPAYANLLEVCQEELRKAGCSSLYIRYGKYPRGQENAYHNMLRQCKALLYLSENETQGFAYNEALSMGVPILAWNYGKWCDPFRFKYGLDDIPATSIPYWDERCGLDFRTPAEFSQQLGLFLEFLRGGNFSPRQYVLENLRLEQGAQRYIDILTEAENL
ncbi:MAG TPA: hypothetical protein V6D28_18090 [Leptolyngbyaceae cyanobacterium]